MNTPTPANPRTRSGDRGFVFLLVLVLLIVASLMLGVGLTRGVTQSLAVQRQIEGYQRHHELLGILDIVTEWINRAAGAGKFRLFAIKGGIAYRSVLGPDHVVLISVADAQGSIFSRVDRVRDRDMREWLLATLSRLPPDRTDLLRSKGPPEISILTAPDEVLQAMAGDSQELFDGLKSARDDRATDANALISHLTRAGVVSPKIQQMIRFIALDPQLYRVTAVVLQRGDQREYQITTLVTGNDPTMLDIRSVPRGRQSDLPIDDESFAADSAPAAPSFR
ncbi:MAG TPA: hypothetical protein VG797_02495 [Phycisphaerales bacterium]|nr:hypothetical protein [Phycisphaerales bacterium]